MKCPKCESSKIQKNGSSFCKNMRAQKFVCLTCGYSWRDYGKKTRMRRIFVGGDFHCGHLTGLTPPEFWAENKPYNNFRKESWQWFSNLIKQLQPFDYAIYNGDMIDGKQPKSGGLELLENDRFEQVRMAVSIAEMIKATKSIVVRGTKYHVGKEENFEDEFAYRINAPIFDRFLGDIGGKVFDIRHKIGRSSIPYGRFTPLSKQVIWNRLRDERFGVKADIIIRNHVHYHIYLEENDYIAMTCPALQGASAYGAQECDGEVDYGFVVLDIMPDGRVLKHSFLKQIDSLKPLLVEI